MIIKLLGNIIPLIFGIAAICKWKSSKINNNQISDIFSKDLPARQAGAAEASSQSRADASLQVSYDAVIEKAQQAPASDVDAVEKARQLLASGDLDSPENIRKAAQNIAQYGV